MVSIGQQFQNRSIEKEYTAIVLGDISEDDLVITDEVAGKAI
jgi:23S rRNA-/tRNA-specific pseudouridylate synthase